MDQRKPTKVDAADTKDSTGVYLTSEGVKGGAVWSTRGRWCTLTGTTGAHTSTIAIIDHPGNPGYTTYWHARGYGLFAANPLSRIFDFKQPAFNFTIEKDTPQPATASSLHSTVRARKKSTAKPTHLRRQTNANAFEDFAFILHRKLP